MKGKIEMKQLKRWFSHLGLYQYLMIPFITIFLLAVIVILVTSETVTGITALKNYGIYTERYLQDLNQKLEYITSDIENKSRYIISEDTIQEMLQSTQVNGIFETKEISKAKETIVRLIMEQDYIESVSIYNFEGRGFSVGNVPSYISNVKNWTEQEWYKNVLEQKGMYLWEDADFAGISGRDHRIIMSRTINKKDSMDGIGVLLFTISNSYIENMLKDMSEPATGKFYISNGKNIVFSSDKVSSKHQDILERLIQEKNPNMTQYRYLIATRIVNAKRSGYVT